MSKNLCLIDWYIVHYIALWSTFIPCSKSYNETRLGLESQIKRNPYTKWFLITKENIKLSPVTITLQIFEFQIQFKFDLILA